MSAEWESNIEVRGYRTVRMCFLTERAGLRSLVSVLICKLLTAVNVM